MSQASVDAPARGRWLGFAALAGGLALVVLDGTIVGVSLPSMVAALRLDLASAQWITTGYAMVFAALLLAFGRLGDNHGRLLIFELGVVVFLAASLWCAAGGASGLIAGRLLQGVGAAMVLPASLSSVNATFRGRDRAVAFGWWGAIMAAAAAIGPLLGGWLTTTFGWPAIFLVNLPLGVVVLVLANRFAPESRGEQSSGFDVVGLITSALGLALVVFALIEGWNLGWLQPSADWVVAGLTWPVAAPVSVVPIALLLGLVLLGAFWLVEGRRLRGGRPVLLDLTLLTIPTFAAGNLAALAVAAGEFALLFVLPLFLVFGLDLDAMGAGWVLAAMAGGAFIAGAQARRLSARLGATRVVILGLLLELVAGVGTALLLTFGPHVVALAALMGLYGLGLGLASAQLTSVVLADVPVGQSGSGSATQSTVRQLGSAIGAAAAGTALAAGFTVTVPSALLKIPGVSASDAHTMIDYMIRTAGSVIGWIRDKGTEGYFGRLGPQVADALVGTFATSAAWAVWTASAFIALGLAGALRVHRAAQSHR